jgi:acyl dehydratase
MSEIGYTWSKPYVFTLENIRQFATYAGDENPLHHDEAVAKASRFGTIIACGAHMSGVLMSVAASRLAGVKESVGLEFTFRFVKAIPAGTETVLSWTSTGSEPNEKLKGDIVTAEGKITDADGKIYVISVSKGLVWW